MNDYLAVRSNLVTAHACMQNFLGPKELRQKRQGFSGAVLLPMLSHLKSAWKILGCPGTHFHCNWDFYDSFMELF